MRIFIPDYVKTAMQRLAENGFCSYIVGGCVRDCLLGKNPNDYDVCTDCPPNKMAELFEDFHTIQTGLKHGTLTVIVQGNLVEITTFRSDGVYSDHRRPERVTFEKSLNEDLKRRDFTVNAMAYSEDEGVIDLYGGREDLENGVIRCVGNAAERFEEDALRIMRGLRFASVLGFEIEKNTAAAMMEKGELLSLICVERIFAELKKLLCGQQVQRILMDYRDLIAVVIPELKPTFGCRQNCKHHCLDVYGHIAKSVASIEPNEELRLCMLFHDIEKPRVKKTDESGIDHFKMHQYESARTAQIILKRLKCPKKQSQKIISLIWEHDNRIPAQRKPVKRLISKYGYDFFFDWIKVRRADALAQSPYMREHKLEEIAMLEEIGKSIYDEDCCFKLSDLAINGRDAASLGFVGKEIGLALNAALEAVIEEKIENERQAITDYLRRYFNEKA